LILNNQSGTFLSNVGLDFNLLTQNWRCHSCQVVSCWPVVTERARLRDVLDGEALKQVFLGVLRISVASHLSAIASSMPFCGRPRRCCCKP
jgi:hypothetical protein